MKSRKDAAILEQARFAARVYFYCGDCALYRAAKKELEEMQSKYFKEESQ